MNQVSGWEMNRLSGVDAAEGDDEGEWDKPWLRREVARGE